MTQPYKKKTSGLMATLQSFAKDRKGVAAIEFAFIAPVLLCLYFGSMELSQAIETNKKVGRTASMVADLVTQQQSVKKDSLKAIMEIGASTIKPYRRSEPRITVTAINIPADGTSPKRDWWQSLYQDQTTGDAIKVNAVVPADLNEAGTFLIKVDAEMDYQLVLGYTDAAGKRYGITSFMGEGVNMRETYYLRPRMSDAINCTDC